MSKSNKMLATFIFGALIAVVYYYGLKHAEFFTLAYKFGLLVFVSIVSLIICRVTDVNRIWVPIVMTLGVIVGVAMVLLLDSLFTSNSHDLLGWEVFVSAGAVFVFSWIGSLIDKYFKGKYVQSK